MRRYLRPLAGVILIAAAVAFIFFWEVEGRDALMNDKVAVAKETIFPGEIVSREMFREMAMKSDNRIEGGLTMQELTAIEGKYSTQLILGNSQISRKYFSTRKTNLQPGKGIFEIREEWIFSVSSSLRKGDQVEIYMQDGEKLGVYPVAFVKDGQGKEVVDQNEQLKLHEEKEILDRANGSGVIMQLEIIANMEEYGKILDFILHENGQIILVNREES